ncbi:MAG: hypothetical protein PVG30_08970 [Gammaproteobacteria bacterium]|jgi:hypothetical protein
MSRDFVFVLGDLDEIKTWHNYSKNFTEQNSKAEYYYFYPKNSNVHFHHHNINHKKKSCGLQKKTIIISDTINVYIFAHGISNNTKTISSFKGKYHLGYEALAKEIFIFFSENAIVIVNDVTIIFDLKICNALQGNHKFGKTPYHSFAVNYQSELVQLAASSNKKWDMKFFASPATLYSISFGKKFFPCSNKETKQELNKLNHLINAYNTDKLYANMQKITKQEKTVEQSLRKNQEPFGRLTTRKKYRKHIIILEQILKYPGKPEQVVSRILMGYRKKSIFNKIDFNNPRLDKSRSFMNMKKKLEEQFGSLISRVGYFPKKRNKPKLIDTNNPHSASPKNSKLYTDKNLSS